jgi:hypothetical protein
LHAISLHLASFSLLFRAFRRAPLLAHSAAKRIDPSQRSAKRDDLRLSRPIPLGFVLLFFNCARGAFRGVLGHPGAFRGIDRANPIKFSKSASPHTLPSHSASQARPEKLSSPILLGDLAQKFARWRKRISQNPRGGSITQKIFFRGADFPRRNVAPTRASWRKFMAAEIGDCPSLPNSGHTPRGICD